MSQPLKPQLSLNEATKMLRDAGYHLSPKTLALGIQQGVYPFEYIITDSGNVLHKIYTNDVRKYIKEHAVKDEAEI